MKRSQFFAFLAALVPGVAAAQQWKECVPDERFESTLKGTNSMICSDKRKPALPNQCPVCGTMAKPYVRKLGMAIVNLTEQQSADCTAHLPPLPAGAARQDCGRSAYRNVPVGPMERVTRCARCNAAFWVDATA